MSHLSISKQFGGASLCLSLSLSVSFSFSLSLSLSLILPKKENLNNNATGNRFFTMYDEPSISFISDSDAALKLTSIS